MRLCWRDIRPSFLKYNSKTTAIPEIIPVVLICTAGIISAARMHLYLPLLLHRDYFRRPDASLPCSFAPQGLFLPPGFISILLLCSTGIISTARIHLYLPLLSHRDYFRQSDASLSCSFVPQGLFPPVGFIPSLLFSSTGMISPRSDASLSSSFAPQGLFPPPGFISIFLFCFTGIIFPRSDSSLSSSFAPQGLFPPVGCISILLFCSTEIISTVRMHLYLPLLLHRDYFQRPNASLSCSFVTQGLFRPPGFIPSLLFCSTGIISASRMHL